MEGEEYTDVQALTPDLWLCGIIGPSGPSTAQKKVTPVPAAALRTMGVCLFPAQTIKVFFLFFFFSSFHFLSFYFFVLP